VPFTTRAILALILYSLTGGGRGGTQKVRQGRLEQYPNDCSHETVTKHAPSPKDRTPTKSGLMMIWCNPHAYTHKHAHTHTNTHTHTQAHTNTHALTPLTNIRSRRKALLGWTCCSLLQLLQTLLDTGTLVEYISRAAVTLAAVTLAHGSDQTISQARRGHTVLSGDRVHALDF
jgi:hypothetical protein